MIDWFLLNSLLRNCVKCLGYFILAEYWVGLYIFDG